MCDGWVDSTGIPPKPNRARRLTQQRPNHRNDQMTTKPTTNASEGGWVQIPAQVRDRMLGFHEDSMKTGVSPHIAMHSQPKTEMNQCL